MHHNHGYIDRNLLVHLIEQARAARDTPAATELMRIFTEAEVPLIRHRYHGADLAESVAESNRIIAEGIAEFERDPGDDPRDPIHAAFEDYRRAPRDVVPLTPTDHTDLHRLAGKTVNVVHHELDSTGVARRVERLTITEPLLPERMTTDE